jgi:lipopolysaccharide/colanic/teichoic acid biosynthesis glycosyltransferase
MAAPKQNDSNLLHNDLDRNAVYKNQDRRQSLRPEIEARETSLNLKSIPIKNFSPLFAFSKRALDLMLSALALVVLTPILVAVAVAIKLTSNGPVIFTQERVGLGGKTFRMYKFRTMIQNAEAQKQSLATFNEHSGPAFKMKFDPRITRLGGILRRYSIDELPQLINILLGQMTIVGPRPPLESEVVLYETWQLQRLSVKPGLTCIWQISGRSRLDFATWVRMDIRYIEKASLILDILIIAKTFSAVVKADGAY